MKKIILLSALTIGMTIQSVDASRGGHSDSEALQRMSADLRAISVSLQEMAERMQNRAIEQRLQVWESPSASADRALQEGSSEEQNLRLSNPSASAASAAAEVQAPQFTNRHEEMARGTISSVDRTEAEKLLAELEQYKKSYIRKGILRNVNELIAKLSRILGITDDLTIKDDASGRKTEKSADTKGQLNFAIEQFETRLSQNK